MDLNWRRIFFTLTGIVIAAHIIDWIGHGMFLMDYYNETSYMWRSLSEMEDMFLLSKFLYILEAFAYALTLEIFAKGRGRFLTVLLGTHIGLLRGIGAFNSYVFLPMAFWVALSWGIINIVTGSVAGLIFNYFDD